MPKHEPPRTCPGCADSAEDTRRSFNPNICPCGRPAHPKLWEMADAVDEAAEVAGRGAVASYAVEWKHGFGTVYLMAHPNAVPREVGLVCPDDGHVRLSEACHGLASQLASRGVDVATPRSLDHDVEKLEYIVEDVAEHGGRWTAEEMALVRRLARNLDRDDGADRMLDAFEQWGAEWLPGDVHYVESLIQEYRRQEAL